MPRSRLYFSLTVAGLVACGGIADPTAEQHQTATISGALTTSGATLPSNAHVALVWRVGDTHTFAVGSDSAVTAGHFSLTVDTPPDAYFFSSDDQVSSSISGGAEPPSTTPRSPDPTGSTGSGTTGSGGTGGTFAKSVSPLDVSGQITTGLEIAVAGFVVYADTNGNGQLDITPDTATPSDTILGGSRELFLTYLRGGGALDYEKLRDKSGILPTAGFNLAWTEGRWLPLDEVELKLGSNTILPSPVCDGSGGTYASGGSGGGVATTGNDPSPPPPELDAGIAPDPDDANVDAPDYGGYPSPNDPTLVCAPDGRSYTVTPSCPPPPPSPPPGLCTLAGGAEDMPCAGVGGVSLAPGQDPPPGWPCPVAVDAGPEDGGPVVVLDASAD